MRTLGEISEEFEILETTLQNAGGEITDAAVEEFVDNWLRSLGAERDQKLDGYCQLIEENKLLSAARAAESERLLQLSRSSAAIASRLKDRLEFYFLKHGIKRIETLRHQLWVQRNGGATPVIVNCATEALPQDCVKVDVSMRPDKDKIRTKLEAGEVVDGCALGQRGSSLRIK